MLQLEDILAELTTDRVVTVGGKPYIVTNCVSAIEENVLKLCFAIKNEENNLISLFIEAKAPKK